VVMDLQEDWQAPSPRSDDGPSTLCPMYPGSLIADLELTSCQQQQCDPQYRGSQETVACRRSLASEVLQILPDIRMLVDKLKALQHLTANPAPQSSEQLASATRDSYQPKASTNYNIAGFRTPELNGVYHMSTDLVIGGQRTFWKENGDLFMYFQLQKAKWQICPRWDFCEITNAKVDLLPDALAGGSRGLAMEVEERVWREFIPQEGQWVLTELQIL